MGKLLSMLEAESQKRGMAQHGQAIDAVAAFGLVRDMPYQRASTRAPESIIKEWRGTCSGKHYLLDSIFKEEGMESRVIMATHRFTPDTTANFPPELREVLAKGPVPDVHTYIRLNTELGWMTVDATWPTKAASLGIVVNNDFRPGVDMILACSPIDTYEVPEGKAPQEFKEDLINSFCGSQSDERDRFINGLGEWLSRITS
ncbi:MAG: hypothetical protein O2913_02120 [Chloroflexi bacterium]|nr:hypothetical protein [Chloroflexota bacterium]